MLKLNLLRSLFLKNLNTVYTYNGDLRHLNVLPILSASYEYFRKRNVAQITDFTAKERAHLKKKLPTVYRKLAHKNGIAYAMETMWPEHVYDYAKYRSGGQFLIDDAHQFVLYDSDKEIFIDGLRDGFKPGYKLLSRDVSDYDFADYPETPLPEHEGVPKSHYWWAALEQTYTPEVFLPLYFAKN